MSRRIDVSGPENLSDEDRQYLANRGRSPEQERARQEEIDLIDERVATDEELLPNRLSHMQRTGQPVFGDPARGRMGKASRL